MAIEEAYVVVTLSRATDAVGAFPFATRGGAELAAAFFSRDSGVEVIVISDHDEPEMAGATMSRPFDTVTGAD